MGIYIYLFSALRFLPALLMLTGMVKDDEVRVIYYREG